MKKGTVYTCKGCYCFEAAYRAGAGNWSAHNYPAYCAIGEDIKPLEDKYEYKPVSGTCKKPKTIHDEVEAKRAFYKLSEIQ